MLEQTRSLVVWLNAVDPVLPRALLVTAVFVLVYVFRKLFPAVWELFARAVPVAVVDPAPVLLLLSKLWQALPGALLGAVMLAIGTGGDVRAALKGALGGALAAFAHEVFKAVPWIPYQGAVGKLKSPTLPILMLCVASVFVSVQDLGCSTPPPKMADAVSKAEAAAYGGAVAALLLLDEQEARHLDSLPHPTELQVQQATLRVAKLTRARDALVLVRRILTGELANESARDQLKDAAQALDLVAAELEADGVSLPDELQQALSAARVLL
jgi:hypothetical protein